MTWNLRNWQSAAACAVGVRGVCFSRACYVNAAATKKARNWVKKARREVTRSIVS
jgi:hypothetical protein